MVSFNGASLPKLSHSLPKVWHSNVYRREDTDAGDSDTGDASGFLSSCSDQRFPVRTPCCSDSFYKAPLRKSRSRLGNWLCPQCTQSMAVDSHSEKYSCLMPLKKRCPCGLRAQNSRLFVSPHQSQRERPC